ncbi:hypothetical protein [Acinetobacter bereziniae]|uniref:hypothetical protein n=1 Tax=Acinetobacter bereziniae TaxID=106648 RepID=UPI003009C4E8
MLANLFQIEQFQEFFNDKELILEKYGKNEFQEFCEKFRSKEFQVGLSIWHQIASRQLENVNPYAIANFISSSPVSLCEEINKIVGKEVINDILYFYGRVNDSSLEFNDFAEILLIVTSNNELLIGDIAFSNPYQRIVNPRYIYQEFKGLGFLGEFMDIVENYCNEQGIRRCFLTAAALDLVPLFEKYGYKVQEDPMSQFALKSGASIPMYKLFD